MCRMKTVVCILSLFLFTEAVEACPFCSAVSQTFSEEMKSMDVVAITELTKAALITDLNTGDPAAEVPKSHFQVAEVLKGEEFIKPGDSFETIYFGEAKEDRPYLAMATDAPNLMWSTPLILSARAKNYLLELQKLSDGPTRLAFFQEYLEDPDEMLARDAYDEFAKAPYADLIALKGQMNREKLLSFIQDAEVPSNRRRLYFTMLGVCGRPEDAALLEKLMASSDRKEKAGLDAMVACYIILKGQAALDRVDELFLANKEAEYADTYAAIMAIRFHMTETQAVPPSRLTASLRLMLDRPELADLVIPDLARAEDWSVMAQLVRLFKDADENSSWVRVPVVNYLRACPLPMAAESIEELKAVDPDAVKRAMTFFPLATKQEESKAQADEEPDSSQQDGSDAAREQPGPTQPGPTSSGYAPAASGDMLLAAVTATDSTHVQVTPEPQATPAGGNVELAGDRIREVRAAGKAVATLNRTRPATLRQAELLAEEGTNFWVLLGVTLMSGGLCLVAMRTVLGCGSQA